MYHQAMKSALALALALLAAPPAPAPVSPPVPSLPRGQVIEKIVCAARPDESYALYLPSGYTASRAWPTSGEPVALAQVVAALKIPELRAKATDLLKSVDKGWKDLAALQQEEAFAPLRQDPEYQRVIAALQSRNPS
jgi:hypothetical protein